MDDDEKGIDSIDTPGGRQEMSTVSEPGLYSLILRSRKPEAKRFKRWITHEVLPSIRRTAATAPRRPGASELQESGGGGAGVGGQGGAAAS